MRKLTRSLVVACTVFLLTAAAHAAEVLHAEGPTGFSVGDWSTSTGGPEPSCGAMQPGCGAMEPTCSGACDDCDWCCEGMCCHRWLAGVELTVLKPVAANNVAFTVIETDGATTATSTQTDFDYNVAFAPRVWVEVLGDNDFGLRATYWTADQEAPTQRGVAPANGLGFVAPPVFGTVNLATNVAGTTLDASAHVSANTLDFEGVKHVPGSVWKLCFSGGMRYAYIEQQYQAEMRDDTNAVVANVTYAHRLQGVGPTFAITAGQPLNRRVSLFGTARGSVLFGETATRLAAGEDLADDAFFTTATSTRHDLFSMGEVEVGLQWSPECDHPWKPLVRIAFEGQLWDGPGNAAEEGGLFGYYGLNLALGMAW